MKNQDDYYQIDTIIPATGWKARFHKDSGGYEDRPLICWALCNYEDQQDKASKRILGVVMRHSRKIFCECHKSFSEYLPPKD